MPILTVQERIGTSIAGRYRIERLLARGIVATMRHATICLIVVAWAACSATKKPTTAAAPDTASDGGASNTSPAGAGGRSPGAEPHDASAATGSDGSSSTRDLDANAGSGNDAARSSERDAASAVPDAASFPIEPIIPMVAGMCPTFSSGTIDFAGLHDVLLEVGPRGTGSGSLLLYWHGTGSNAAEVDSLIPAADRQRVLAAGGIIVSPETTTGLGEDCSGVQVWSTGDVDVADQIVACAVRDYAIDPHRIYTTGCASGGFHAACMAQLRSSYIAAVVTNSGGIAIARPFQNAHAPAAMTMYGPSTDDLIDFVATSKALDDAIKNAGGFAIDCQHDKGHCGAPSEFQSAAITFLLDHPFGVAPEPYAAGLPPAFPSSCRIY